MFRKEMSAKKYKVLKPFVFRGVQYTPSEKDGEGVFDPVAAQCVPHKLGNLLRQRLVGDLGPSLAVALKEAQPPAHAKEHSKEANSDADKGGEDTPPNAGKADVFDDKPRRRRQS